MFFWSKSGRDGSGRLVVQPKPLVLWFGSLLILLICLGAAFAAYELRERDIREAQRELKSLDILLVEETERAIQSVDLVLQSIQEKIAAEGFDTAQAFSQSLGKREIQEMLKARITGMPQLDAVELIDAQGRLVNLSRFYPVPDVSVADTDYFQTLKNRTTGAPYMSEPLQSRTAGHLNLFFARRVTDKSGEFAGLIVGALDPAYFRNLFEALQGGKGDGVSLWRRDGTLLANSSSLTDPSSLFRRLPPRNLRRSGEPYSYQVEAHGSSPGRIVAAMTCRQFPLVLSVTRTLHEVLADWYQFLALLLAGTIFCVVTIGAVMWLLVRQFSTYEQLAVAVVERGRAVAQREQAEAQLRQAQKLESIGQLTGGIAHDFNNLLTAVLGNLELLTRHLENKDARLYNFAKNAFDAANRGASLTQRLLTFSRRQPLDLQSIDLAKSLASIGELLRRTLGENIHIEMQVAADIWPIVVDQNQLENAVLNIAINARDAMSGRGRLKIAARNCPCTGTDATAGDCVLLAIADNGKGMEKQVLERVFEPFFSTKPPGRGTGLGLSQVHGFINHAGGRIDIESQVGVGTMISMRFPRAAHEEAIAQTVADTQADSDDRHSNSHILLVEDNNDVRAASSGILRETGYIVREAADARIALAILRSDVNIGLIFTDLGLPGMNGRELVSEARRWRPDIRVLYMTGYAENAILTTEDVENGAVLIVKPFSRAELLKHINNVMATPIDRPAA